MGLKTDISKRVRCTCGHHSLDHVTPIGEPPPMSPRPCTWIWCKCSRFSVNPDSIYDTKPPQEGAPTMNAYNNPTSTPTTVWAMISVLAKTFVDIPGTEAALNSVLGNLVFSLSLHRDEVDKEFWARVEEYQKPFFG